MNRIAFVIASAMLLAAASAAEFKSKPVVEQRDGQAVIRFAVDQPTDVVVAIVNKDGKVVRHLAAGVLGESAPTPLKAGSLEQAISWDGKDDDGKPVQAGCKVRVSLGMSVKFDKFVGDERQDFRGISGIAAGPGGDVYIFDGGQINVLDRDGKYKRQVMPYPADLPADKLVGLGPAKLADGTTFMCLGYPTGKWKDSAVGAMAISPDGKMLYLPGPPRYARKLMRIGTDGSVPANAFTTRLTTHADNGWLYLACSPDGKTLYMAGAMAGYMGDDARELSYRQSVYRLRLDAGDGPAETFTGDDENSGADGFSVHRPKGLATDPAGRVYVCNYGSGNVSVYDAAAGFLKSFPVKHPQQVAVNPKTGQIYVLCGVESGYYKFGYHFPETMHEAKIVRLSADGKPEAEIAIDPPFIKSRKTPTPVTQPEFTCRMAVDFSQQDKPIVWVGLASPAGYGKWGLLRIEDNGKEFGQPRDVSDKVTPKTEVRNRTAVQGMMARMAIDRGRDILYLGAGGNSIKRYNGLNGELMESLKLRDAAGKEAKVEVYEQAIGPDGMIYFSGTTGGFASGQGIFRATPDGVFQPFADGKTPWGRLCKGAGAGGARGFTVSRTGEMFLLYYDDVNRPADKRPAEAWDACAQYATALAKFDASGNLVNRHQVYHLRSGGMGVRVDSRGNIYVADNFMPVGVSYPADIAKVMADDPLKRPYPARLPDATFDPLLRFMGFVLKFGPEGGRIHGLPAGGNYPPVEKPKVADVYRPAPEVQWFVYNYHNLKVTGAEWQFHGISPIPAQYQGVTHVERCVCSGGRFDVDAFDRVFVPDSFRSRVTVLDSAGNIICQFGQYGNRDATGLALASPVSVAAADSYGFVGDSSSRRLVRVNFTYAAQEECELK